MEPLDVHKIRTYVQRLREMMQREEVSEADTILHLITDLLSILRWTRNPDEMSANHIPKNMGKKDFVDFALFSESEAILLIEVKALANELTQANREQLVRYCRVSYTDFGILTNGRYLELHDTRPIGGKQPKETLIFSIDLKEFELYEPVLRYLSSTAVRTGSLPTLCDCIRKNRGLVSRFRENYDKLLAGVLSVPEGFAPSPVIKRRSRQMLDNILVDLMTVDCEFASDAEAEETEDTIPESEFDHPVWFSELPQSPFVDEGPPWGIPEINTSEVEGEDEEIVAIFPTRLPGIDFIKKHNAWGWVRIRQVPNWICLYISRPYSGVYIIGKVQEVIPAATFVNEHRNSLVQEDVDTYDPKRKAILIKPGTLAVITDPIRRTGKEPPIQGHFRTTLGHLKNGNSIGDLSLSKE